ncbi:hypothetical protein BH09BAC1_BH09BAC1_26850 [soil metagenome]
MAIAAALGEEYVYEKDNRRNAFLATIITLALILLILFILGLYRQNPPPEAGGTPLSFGFTDQGMDGITPTSTNPQPQMEQPKEVAQPVTEPVTEPEVLTQDFEEAPVISKPVEQPKPVEKPKETPKEVPKETPKEAPKPQANPNDMFGGFKSDQNNSGSSGTGGDPGMQGKPNGNGPSGIGDGTGTGTQPGSGGNGLGYGLSGRSALKKIAPDAKQDVFGTVRIKITVNSAGKVINAVYSADGSTTADSYLKSISIEAAMKWEWSADPQNRPEQLGYIDFVYKRQ